MKKFGAIAVVLAAIAMSGMPGQAAATQTLTQPLAKKYAKKAIKDTKLRNKWAFGTHREVGPCKRINRTRRRCDVSWVYNGRLYKGHVTVWFLPAHKWGYKTSINWDHKV